MATFLPIFSDKVMQTKTMDEEALDEQHKRSFNGCSGSGDNVCGSSFIAMILNSVYHLSLYFRVKNFDLCQSYASGFTMVLMTVPRTVAL